MPQLTGYAKKWGLAALQLVWALSLILFLAGPAHATEPPTVIEVNTLADTKANDGACSLREAVIAANTNKASGYKSGECAAGKGAVTDVIHLTLAGTYALTRTDSGAENAALTGDLDIKGNVTIVPQAQPTIIDASQITDRVFHILSGKVTISQLTIKGGRVNYEGGGIYNKGSLTLENSTISGNNAKGLGGGIFNALLATTNLNFVTIANNSAKSGGGGIKSLGKLTTQNTIIAGNTSSAAPKYSDCLGIVSSAGYNLFGKGTGCSAKSTDLTVTPASVFTSVFEALSGETGLHTLLSGSPAINAGKPACPPPATDQRGVSRPQASRCDIGAYEFSESGQGGPIFTVNTRDDVNDGLCSPKHCSLREAIQAANARPNDKEGPDIIQFNLPTAGPIQPTSALPAITDPVSIEGPALPVELNGSQAGAGVDGLTLEAGGSRITKLIISHFSRHGLLLTTNGNNLIQDSMIRENGADGLHLTSSDNLIQNNLIEQNRGNGVGVESGINNTVRGNKIFDNNQLGIDLGNDAETANDIDDPDSGANNRQNFPVITRAFSESGSVGLEGRLNSGANTAFALEFFSNESCDPADFGEGQTFLTTISVTTNISGNISFTAPLPPLPDGHFVTATATDANGNTSEFSQCIPISFKNDSWPSAMRLTPGNDVSPAVAEQYLDQVGQSRWYKFSVQPNSQVIVTLTDLPANYDLTIYKDIAAAFKALNSPQDLVQLGAEFAPDAFAVDAFAPGARSPDAFAPGARSPDAFAPDAFAATVFAPGARSPDAFAPGARSPDAFAPGARSPDIFAPDAFAPDAFAPGARSPDAIAPGAHSEDFFTAFSSAQTRSLLGVSAFEGTAGEGLIINTWNNTGDFYVRVRGRDGAFSLEAPFHLEVAVLSEVCNGVTPPSGPPSVSVEVSGRETLILTDLERMAGDTGALAVRLNEFARQVNGHVVDVHDLVADLNRQADANFGCPYAKNLVAEGIKTVVTAYRAENPLKYVVIVGNDEVIPFFRYPDNASLGSETDYIPPVLDATASQASLRLGYVLGQDAYGSQMDISFKNSTIPIPDLAVGRLVETPEDIITVLDAYDATNNGVVETPDNAFVSGYDFLEDAANAVTEELGAGIGAEPNTLIALKEWSPADPRSWTGAQLREELLSTRHDIIFLAGHFSAQSALAADYTTRLTTADLVESDVDLTNAIVYSAGCHSGYNVVNEHNIPQVTVEPDWAQAFAQKGALLIAGTGYQYGDTDFIEYGERLYLEFTRELRAGSGAIAVGQALVKAKQVYLASTPDLGGLHEKTLLQATLFGLPMLSVDMAGSRFSRPDDRSVVAPTPFTTNPGKTLKLTYADLTINPTLTETPFRLTNIEDGSLLNTFYLNGGNGIVSNVGEPTLPLEVRNVTVTGTVLRGVGFRGGLYQDRPEVLPVVGTPSTEIRGAHSTFLSDIFYPVQPWRVNYFEALSDGSGGATRLMVLPAQFKSSSPGSQTNILRQFNSLGLRLYYSNNIETFTTDEIDSTPALAAAPAIVEITGEPGAGKVDFKMRVAGDPSAGIQEVWVTYTAVSGSWAGQWQSLDLVQNPADSTLWEGSLTLPPATSPTDIRYLVQAANGVGMVGMATNQGAYYIPGVQPGPGQSTALILETPPSSGRYGTQVTLSARLTQSSDGQPLVGRVVIFGLGPQSQIAGTGNDGRASATLSLLGLPGNYDLKISFAGTAGDAPSSATSPFTITKQNTQLTLEPASATGHPDDEQLLVATLTDGAGLPLFERTVFFVLEGNNEVNATIPVITDYAGRASLGRLDLPFGIYNLTVYFNGSIPLPTGSTLNLNDERYNPASPVTGQLTLQNILPEATNDVYETDEDVVLTVTEAEGILSNDTDDGAVLTATLVSPPFSGTLTLEPNGAFSYTPTLNFNGLITFTYQADDGTDLSNTATVSITVKPLNDAPLAVADTYETPEDTSLVIAPPGVLSNDSDVEGSPLTAHLLSSPANGDLDLDSTGAFTYTPEANFNGTDTFIYQARDGVALSSFVPVTLTITPVNDPLVAGDTSTTTPEESPVTITITDLVTDIDGDLDLSLVQVVAGPAHGSTSVDPLTGDITYTPELDFNGTDVFTYQVSDGELSDTGAVSVLVTPVNDPPVANDDLAETAEDEPVAINVLANDNAGPANEDQALSITGISEPEHGAATLDVELNQIIYTPNPEFSGTDSFSYTACDSEALCDTANVAITIHPVNDAPPEVQNDEYNTDEDTPLTVGAEAGVLSNDSDADGDALTAALVNGPAYGELLFNEDGSFSYLPGADFNGVDNFTYEVSDGFETSDTATVTITVNPVNDPPAVNDDTANTAENTPVTIDVLANDNAGPADEDQSLTITNISDPAHGTAVLDDKTNQIIYTPETGFNGEDSFSYTACDSEGLCDDATVNVSVTLVNDLPVAVDDNYITDEDTPLTVEAGNGVLFNDSDPDGDALTAVVVDGPAYGELSLNADGSFTYVPDANFNGADSFTYQANDGLALSNTATVTITVNPVEDVLDCSTAVANPTFIWPPNNKFVTVSIEGVSSDSGPVTITIDGIFQDEPVGKKPHGPDGDGLGTSTAKVRAERDGKGDGRVYHIDFTAEDSSKNACSGEVLVAISHDQGTDPGTIDGGRLYNSVTGEPQ